METQENTWNVANRMHSNKDSDNPALNHIITGADEIYDDTKGKKQDVINAETDAALAEHGTAIRALNSQNYVTVPDYASLPQSGQSADTVYRVSNYDGALSAVDSTKYSEYAWDGTQYFLLSVKSAIEEVFDVSEYNASGGSYATYTDLADLLDNHVADIPTSRRKGGMSIKFIQSSDNKYVQFRCTADEFTTDTTQWAIADEGVYVDNHEFVYVKTDSEGKILWAIKTDGTVYFGAGVPPQIISYINDKIAELSLDEYEDIVTFLADYLGSDTTLKVIIDGINAAKVDKEEGKSLIDAEFAEGVNQVESHEFTEVHTDAENKILYGIKKGGDFYFGAGIPSQIQEELNNKVNLADFVDLNENKVDKEEGKSLIDEEISESLSAIEDPEGRTQITVDVEQKVVSYRDEDGILHENVGIVSNSMTADSSVFNTTTIEEATINGGNATFDSLSLTEEGMTEFRQALKDAGFQPGGAGDWSEYISKKGKDPLHLPVPRLAYINLTNTEGNLAWPTSKAADFEAIMEYCDMQGNYFKKNIIFNAQGNSSMGFIKKNGSIKMFDSSVYNSKGKKGKGDKFSVKFGDWVPQTTYHIKAFYTDFFKGVSWISYQIALAVANTRSKFEDRTWKKGLFKDYSFTAEQFNNPQIKNMNLQIDNGALCQPDGFPCIVHLNEEFYGIYVWMIKKDAANFNMENIETHIHLDGQLNDNTLFGANGNANMISWNPNGDAGFEIRNPENLVCFPYTKDGKDCWEYDADVDAVQELAGVSNYADSINDYSNSTTYAKKEIVSKNNRVFASLVDGNVGNDPEDAESLEHDEVFDNATEYWIDITFTNEVKKNILLLTTYKSNVNSAASVSDKKALYEQYFDLNNQIDYEVVQMATGDADGFSKNWQWTTWDGKKWFVNNYDKDCAFGNSPSGLFTSVPRYRSWPGGVAWMTGFLANNYIAELTDRWNELVEKGIFTKEYIEYLFKNWVQRIGSINYQKEYTKWNESPCNRDSGINTDYWEFVSLVYSDNPQTTYDSTVGYHIGDTCNVAYSSYIITFKCIADCLGENPIYKRYTYNPTILGYRDNLWRVYSYIEDNLENINNFVNQ